MNARLFRQFVLCGVAGFLVAGLLAAGLAHAQGARFAQRERVALAMDNAPERVIAALESILSQEQLTELESALLPAPSDSEKRAALDDVKQRLLRAGFANDDPIVTAIATRTDAIAIDTPADALSAAKE
jgi:hypothetical protein